MMPMDQAVANLQQAANPNYGEMPTDQLVRHLRQKQLANLQAQQQGIDATKQQIAAVRNRQGPDPLKNPMVWGALADLFSPQGQKTNFAATGAALMKPDTRMQEEYNLQRQLAGQEANLARMTGNVIDGLEGGDDRQWQFDLADKRHQNAMELERLRQQGKKTLSTPAPGQPMTGKQISEDLTVAEKQVDKEFGKEYSKWTAGGGFANVQGNLKALSGAQKRIDDPNSELGDVWLPEIVRKKTNPESVSIQQDVGKVVYQSLKEILGGQFTEKEGQRLMEQTYDPSLPDEENSKKVQAAYDTLSRMAAAKEAAAAYYRENRTLKGFQGSNANNLEEYTKELMQKEGIKTKQEVNDDDEYHRIIGGK